MKKTGKNVVGRATTLRFPAEKHVNVDQHGRDGSNSRMVPLAVVTFLLLLSWVDPFSEKAISEGPLNRADYGIFDRISELHTEQETRVDDPLVVEEVTRSFGGMVAGDHEFPDPDTSRFSVESITSGEPLTKSPIIFDALEQNPIVNNTEILDWLLPPPLSSQGALNYLVYAHHPDHSSWSLGSMIPRIGLFTDSSLDKWLYMDLDGNPYTGNADGSDIRARMTFARDLLERDWDITLVPPSIQFRNAGLRIELEALETINGTSGMEGNIYFVKGISYEERNYLWSIGISMGDIADRLVVRVSASRWIAEPSGGIDLISQILSGTVDLRDLGFLEVVGPFKVSYEFGTPPEGMDLLLSVMRMFNRTLRDMAYLDLKLERDRYHDRVLDRGYIQLNVKDLGSPVDGIQWVGGDPEDPDPADTLDLSVRYSEFGDDLVDAEISLTSLPCRFGINITSSENPEGNTTRLEIDSSSVIPSLYLKESIYESWNESGPLVKPQTMELKLDSIPRRVSLETTTDLPFNLEDEPVSTVTGNILDVFMSQMAGRFYRVGTALRQVPRGISTLPSSKGWALLDCRDQSIGNAVYRFSQGQFINGTANSVGFLVQDDGSTSISANVRHLSRFRTSFLEENHMELTFTEQSAIRIIALDQGDISMLTLEDPPEYISLRTSESTIRYAGQGSEGTDGLGALRYSLRTDELLFDVNILDLPRSLDIDKGNGLIDVRALEGMIGVVEVFATNGTDLKPIDLIDRNFASVLAKEGRTALGLRLNNLVSLTYYNGTGGFINITTAGGANLYIVVRDEDNRMDVDLVLHPLPEHLHIMLPSLMERPDFAFPDLSGIQSIDEYAQILFSLSVLGMDGLKVASGLSSALTRAVGTYSTDFRMDWDLGKEDSSLDLVLTVEKRGAHDVPDPHWTHGIWIEQEGAGIEGSLKGKVYLNGMPSVGMISLSFSEETISASFDLVDYSPDFDWMLIRTAGVQSRDISLYVTGLVSGMDFFTDVNITTDLSIGGKMAIRLSVKNRDPNGDPLNIGPILGTLRKSEPILSIRQMYLPQVPADFSLYAHLEKGLEMDYSASEEVEYLYFKILKRMEERWSQIYAFFHDLPTDFDISIGQNTDFTIQEPFPLQGLPEMVIDSSNDRLDVFVEYDGSGVGQRGRFQIYAQDIADTRTYYEDGRYVIDSEGIGFLYLDMDRVPAMDSFTLNSLRLLGEDVKHVEIEIQMLFGLFPVIRVEETRGSGLQIRTSQEIDLGGSSHDITLFFINLERSDVLGLPVLTGISVTRDTSVVDLEKGDGNIIVPAPVLSFWYWALSPLWGGG